MRSSNCYLCALCVGIVGLIAGLSQPAAAAMLLTDAFDNANPSSAYEGTPPGTGDYGVNQGLAGRQSGSEAAISYNRRPADARGGPFNTQVNRPTAEGMLAFYAHRFFKPYVVLDRNFTPDVTLTADLNPAIGDATSPNWVAICLRGQTDSHAANVPLSPTSGVSFLMKADGTWAVIRNGDLTEANLVRGAVAPADTYSVALTVEGPMLSGTVNGLPIGQVFLAEAAVGPPDGPVDGPPIGGIPLYGPAAGADNYIAISAYTAGEVPDWHGVDNLVITEAGATPEPATVLMLCALAVPVLRKRRTAA